MHLRRYGSFLPAILGIFLFSSICLWFFLTLPPLPERSKGGAPSGSSTAVVRGAFHIHTNRSDGSGSVNEIAHAAAEANLDFVIFTDHGNGHGSASAPRFIEDVLCIDAVEISTDSGHYIAVGLPSATPYPLGGDSQGVVEDVRRLGGFGVAAHPFSPKPDLQWTDATSQLDGIEILNGDSQWRDETFLDLLLAGVHSFVRPASSFARLLDRSHRTFKYWDDLGKKRRTVGLAGADIHGRIPLSLNFREHESSQNIAFPFPKYKDVFRAFSNRVILQSPFSHNPIVDASNLIESMRGGRLFTVMDGVAEVRHFSFIAKKAGEIYEMGSVVVPDEEITFHSKISGPQDIEMVLYKDGVPVAKTTEATLEYPAGSESSVYRVEVFLVGDPEESENPWLMSNPIYVGNYSDRTTHPLIERGSVHVFSSAHWHVEQSADESTGSLEFENNVVDFKYVLGNQSEADSFVAAVHDEQKLNLKEATDISFDVLGDRPMRLLLQLRAGSLERQPRWIRSFYADSNKRNVSIALDSFLPVEPSQSPTILFDEVDSVLFVAELTNHSPGDTGFVQISNIRTFGNERIKFER